jgi:hypothetical protein
LLALLITPADQQVADLASWMRAACWRPMIDR